MGERVFKTLDEQVSILRSRRLEILDEEVELVKNFLLLNNYYRISGYSLTLRNHDVFYEGTTFRNIMDIYTFDCHLRNILMAHLETVEVSVKSVFAYEFSKRYGGNGYLDSDNFTDPQEYLRIIGKADVQKTKNLSDEAYIQHYVNDLQTEMPLWVYVDLLTFSDISSMYCIAKPDLQKTIAEFYGLRTSNGVDILKEYLRTLSILRNFCAHGRRLFNRLFVRKPSLSSKEKKLLRRDENGVVDNAHLYGFVIELRRLLSSEDFLRLKTDIVSLTEKYPFVSMKYYGFRETWKDDL